ncbi:hypothetical protein A3750_21160, partial [Oleiphilus sp. HI0079]|uniref:glycosyltransferase n=2 Tax=Oleiphilus TaxID=141450 RepID=UPI0007C203A8
MQYSDKPLFSIIVALNKREDELMFSLDSVVSQTYRNVELLLIDQQDETSDHVDVPSLLDRMSAKGMDARIVDAQRGLKAGEIKNMGLQQAKGQLITFLKPGDRWEPHYLEEVLLLTKAFPEAEAFATAYQWHVDSEDFIDPKIHLSACATGPGLLNEFFDCATKGGQPFVLSSFVACKKLFDRVGLFNTEEEAGHEHDLFCRAALYSAIAYSPSVLAFAKNDHADAISHSFVASEWSAFVSRVKSYAASETEAKRKLSVSRYVGAYLLELASLSMTKQRTDLA